MDSTVRGSVDWERSAVWTIGLLIIGASLFIGYFATPYTASPSQLQDGQATPGVTVTTLDTGYVLSPDDTDSARGFVFYPGARVHPNAYIPVLAPVAARTGVTIVIPQPPLNLAVLSPDMAAGIIDSNPRINQWYVGGHSLGGAMACRFASGHTQRVTGLVLLASYCDRDISNSGLRVLTVRGSADTVLDQQAYERNRDHLPVNRTTATTIQGMNHTQFGSYQGQPGDGPATISTEGAQTELRRVITAFFEQQ